MNALLAQTETAATITKKVPPDAPPELVTILLTIFFTALCITVIVACFSNDGMGKTIRAFLEGFAAVVSAARGNDPALVNELRARTERMAVEKNEAVALERKRADGAQAGLNDWFKQTRDLEKEVAELRAWKKAREGEKRAKD